MKTKNISKIISAVITILIITLTLSYVAFADGAAADNSSSDVEDASAPQNDDAVRDNAAADDKKTEGKSKKAEGRSLRSTPEPIIKLTQNETLILGKNNKYIVKNLNGADAIPKLERPIADGDWSDDPTDWVITGTTARPDDEDNLRVGYYNENTIIEIADTLGTWFNGTNIYTIPGITPTIKQIKMSTDSVYHTHLYFLEDTNLNIKSGSLVGLDFSMVPPTPHTQTPQNDIFFHTGAKVNVVSNAQGLNTNTGALDFAGENSLKIDTVQASALPAVVSGRVSVQKNSDLIINSKSTTYGIKLTKGIFSNSNSVIDVTIASGTGIEAFGTIDARKLSSDYTGSVIRVNVLGDGTGIKIFETSPTSAYRITVSGDTAVLDVKVGGVGVGILIPNKLGGITFESGTISVDVNDGVGIYSKGNVSVFEPGSKKVMDVKVNKGVAGALKDLSMPWAPTVESTFSFVSSGASDNTTVLPGEDLPKSAGFVFLVTDIYPTSSISGTVNFIAKAPKDIKGSYGIYTKVLTPFYMQMLAFDGIKAEIEGDIGVETGLIQFMRSELIMNTKTNAIIAEQVYIANAKTPVDLHGDDVAIKLINNDPSVIEPGGFIDNIYLNVRNSTLNITAGNYGIHGVNDNVISDYNKFVIDNSVINVTTTEPNSVGIYVKENISPSELGIAIRNNSTINVDAVKDGIVLVDLQETVITNSIINSKANEVAIDSNTSIKTVGTTKIHGISKETPPDTPGKKPALYFGTAANGLLVNSGTAEIIEEYLTKSTKQLTEKTPYMAYAGDRNAIIGAGNTWNDSTDWPYTDARKDIIAKATGLTSVNAGKDDLIVGSMHKDGLKNIINLNATPSTYKVMFRADINNLVVSFNTDGGTPVPTDQYKLKGEKIDAPVTVTKVGHEFVEWVDAVGDTWNFDTSTVPTNDDLVLKAVWEKLKYTIEYNGNVGTTGDVITGLPTTETVEYEDLASVPVDPSRIGYDFINWSTDIAGANVFDFATTKITENKKLYAKWEAKTYNVDFDMDGGTPQETTQPVKYREKIAKPAANPTKVGYKFLGWTKDAAGATPFNFATEKMPANDIIIYAQWEPIGYIVNYNANGGAPENQQKTFKYSEPINKPNVEPTRRLYKFDKWYKDKAQTIPFDFTAETMPANDITVYAGWIRTHYEVFFDVNGGDETTKPPAMAVEIGKPIDISKYQPGGANAPKYKANFLLGWENKKDNSKVTGPITMGTEDVNLRAMWISADGLFTFSGANSIVGYKDEITKDEVNEKASGTAGYTDFLGNEYKIDIIKEWNVGVISSGGVEKINLFINDSLGNKVPIKEDIHVYILNRAYINGIKTLSFEQYQNVSKNGSNWSVYAYKELPDFSTKTIIRLPLQTKFLSNGFSTEYSGIFYPIFEATDVDYFGNQILLAHEATAIVHAFDAQAAMARRQLEKEEEFWKEVAKTLHLSKSKENWHIDGKTYIEGPSRNADLKNTKEFDRVVVAEPFSFLNMSSEPLQVLKEQKNSRLIVKQSSITWYFDSKDFRDAKIEPTGFYTLRLNTDTNNDKLTQVAKKGNSMQLHFELNKYWQGKATMELELNSQLVSSAKKGNNIYLFNLNKNTNELELIGRMKNTTGSKYSIKLNGIFEEYVIMDHLPGGAPKTVAKASAGTLAKPSSNNTVKQVSSDEDYKITNLTNDLDKETIRDINENLSKRNKTIEQISLVNTSITNMDKEKNVVNPILIIVLVILVVSILSLTVFLVIKRKKDNENDENYTDNSYNF